MKIFFCFLVLASATVLFTQCKKDKGKLENPFGMLLLGSDTSLPDGKYVIRTPNGCDGFASTLRCDYTDNAIGMNGSLVATDILNHYDIDSSEIWYVKKVRYRDPDPYYRLAFGYRIYQMTPGGGYRFLSFTATATTYRWTDDEIGFTYTNGRNKSVKAGMFYSDTYPLDPVPGLPAGIDDTTARIETRSLFQFYAATNSQGAFNLKAGGRKAEDNKLVNRWIFCLGFKNNSECNINAIYPHFRDEINCEDWQESGEESRRCWIGDIYFQKVY